jgi:tRNA (guanine-N7-)-methyltransferase
MHALIPGFYGRTMGKSLSLEKAQILSEKLPAVNLHNHLEQGRSWPFSTPCWIEIGFGFAEHFLAQQKQNPEVPFIGAEVFKNGIAHCLKHLPKQHKCWIFPENVHLLMPVIPAQSIERIFILFPDPWPKKRHHKRRLLQTTFLDQCFRTLTSQGVLYLASDVPDLVGWMLDVLQQHPGFVYKAGATSADPTTWPAWPLDWPSTRYGSKATHKAFMIWEKS